MFGRAPAGRGGRGPVDWLRVVGAPAPPASEPAGDGAHAATPAATTATNVATQQPDRNLISGECAARRPPPASPQVGLGQPPPGPAQPGLDHDLLELGPGDAVELDEDRRVAVEVRGGEEHARSVGE